MTHQSYTDLSGLLKSSRDSIGGWEVITADGDVFQHSDIVTASACCHELQGRLYRVMADASKPHSFRRVRETPLPMDIAKSCLNRIPRKPEMLRCVPVFGR